MRQAGDSHAELGWLRLTLFKTALRSHVKGTLGSVRQFPFACISRQFGLASAPTIPQDVHTIRGRKVLTRMSSDQLSACTTASWWHGSHVTESDRTPSSRMLPSVIGGPGGEGMMAGRGTFLGR